MSNIELGITLKAREDGSFNGVLTGSTEQIKRVGVAGDEAGRAISAGAIKGREGISAMLPEVERLSGAIQRVGHYGAAYFGISELAGYGRAVIDVADQYTALESRLKLATRSQDEFNVASTGLFAIAQRNGAPLAETIALYNKLSPALRELGGDQQQTLHLADLTAKSLRLSGAGAAESAAAMLQFSQALGSGVVRGDEFNSLMETAPRLMQAVADGLHQPLAALRGLAEEGKLTSEAVANALLSQNEVLSAEMAKMPLSVSGAWTKLGNSVTQEVGRMNEATGGTRMLAAGIEGLANNVEGLVGAVETLGGVSAATFAVISAPAAISAGIAGFVALREAALLYKAEGLLAVASGVTGVTAAQAALKAEIAALPAFVSTASGAMVKNVQRAALETELAATTLSNALLTKFKGLSTFAKGGLIGGALWALYEAADYIGIADQISNGVSSKLGKIQEQISRASLEDLYVKRQQLKAEQGGLIGGRDNLDFGKIGQELQVVENQIAKLESRAHAAKTLQGTQAIRDYAKNYTDKYASRAEQMQKELADEEKSYQLARAAAERNGKSLDELNRLAGEHEKVRGEIRRKFSEKSGAARERATDSATDTMQLGAVKAQLEVNGMSAAAAAAQVQVYSLALKGAHEIEKLMAAGKTAQAEALRRTIDAQIEAAQATANQTIAYQDQITAQKEADKAWKQAGDFLDQIRLKTQQSSEDQIFQASLIGKSAVEVARLNAENRARLEIDRELAALARLNEKSPGAADAGIAEINKNRPDIITAAGDAAAAGAQTNLARQGMGMDAAATEQANYEQQLAAAQAYEDQRVAIAEKAGMDTTAIHQNAAKMRETVEQQHRTKLAQLAMAGLLSGKQLEELDAKGKLQLASTLSQSLLGQAAQHSRAAFNAIKAVRLAEAAVTLPSSVMKAYDAGLAAGGPAGPVVGAAFAAVALTTQLANMNAIASASFGGGGGSASAGGGGGAGAGALPGQSTNSSVPYYAPNGSGAAPGAQAAPASAAAPSVNLTLIVQAIEPNALTDASRQQIADSLAAPLQQAFGRNAQQTITMV